MEKVIEEHLAELAELCRRAGARRLDVFGSVARGEFDPSASDLDFFVEFEDLPPARYADAFSSLKQDLEALFGRPVDLITEANLANPYFRARVEAERQAVYASSQPQAVGGTPGGRRARASFHAWHNLRTRSTQ